MKKPKTKWRTQFELYETYEASPLIVKLKRKMEGIATEGADIDESIPIIYTNRADGVFPETNIRSDRFEIAREAIDKINQAHAEKILKKQENPNRKEEHTESVSDAGGLS